MQVIRFTLVADGSSDRALLPVLVWLLREHFGNIPIQPAFSDLRRLRNPPGQPFERIAKGVELYPCDLLFVHRDAERETMNKRVEEIRESLARSAIDTTLPVVWDDIEAALGGLSDTGHEWDDDPAAWVRRQRHDDPRFTG